MFGLVANKFTGSRKGDAHKTTRRKHYEDLFPELHNNVLELEKEMLNKRYNIPKGPIIGMWQQMLSQEGFSSIQAYYEAMTGQTGQIGSLERIAIAQSLIGQYSSESGRFLVGDHDHRIANGRAYSYGDRRELIGGAAFHGTGSEGFVVNHNVLLNPDDEKVFELLVENVRFDSGTAALNTLVSKGNNWTNAASQTSLGYGWGWREDNNRFTFAMGDGTAGINYYDTVSTFDDGSARDLKVTLNPVAETVQMSHKLSTESEWTHGTSTDYSSLDWSLLPGIVNDFHVGVRADVTAYYEGSLGAVKVKHGDTYNAIYYPFPNPDGSRVLDASGNDLHSDDSATTQVAYETGETHRAYGDEIGYGKAIHFLASSQEYVDFGTSSNSAVLGSNNRRFKAKCIPYSYSSSPALWSIYNGVGSNRAFIAYIASTGYLAMILDDTGSGASTYLSTTLQVTTNTLNDIEWFVDFDNSEVVFSLNGVTQSIAITETGMYSSSTAPLRMGAQATGFGHFDGLICEASIEDENGNDIIKPNFGDYLRGTSQYSSGSSNTTGTLTSGAAIKYLPVKNNSADAVFDLPVVGQANVPAAQFLKMADGLAIDMTSQSISTISSGLGWSANADGKHILIMGGRMHHDAATVKYFDTRISGSEVHNIQMQQSVTDLVQMYRFATGGSNEYRWDGLYSDNEECYLRWEFDNSGTGSELGIRVKKSTDLTIPWEYLPYIPPTTVIADDELTSNETIDGFNLGGRYTDTQNVDAQFNYLCFNNVAATAFYFDENAGDSYSADGSVQMVHDNAMASGLRTTIDLGKYRVESQGANSGIGITAIGDSCHVDWNTGDLTRFKFRLFNMKNYDWGGGNKHLCHNTAEVFILYADSSDGVRYQVDDSGLTVTGYTHQFGDSYEVDFDGSGGFGVFDIYVTNLDGTRTKIVDGGTCTSDHVSFANLFMGSNSARTTAAKGVIGGFELEVNGSVIRSYYGERTTVDRQGNTITQYGSVSRAYFAKGSNGLDHNHRAIDFPDYIPDTGFELDKPSVHTPKMTNIADTNIVNTALTSGGHRLFIDQKGKPGYLKNLVATDQDLAAKSGPLVNNLEGVRNLISDPLIDVINGNGNPYVDGWAYWDIFTDSGSDGSRAVVDGELRVDFGATNTFGNDSVSKYNETIESGVEYLDVIEIKKSNNLSWYWVFASDGVSITTARGTSAGGSDPALVADVWTEFKDFATSSGVLLDLWHRTGGTNKGEMSTRKRRVYKITPNQRAA